MKPRHPKAIYYLRLGLFDDLAHFNELESRISQLETPQERGDAFEVFAEAYFSSVQKTQARKVYPWGRVPAVLRKQLKVKPEQDKGIDGVFTTGMGQLVAYQVKFRSGRKSLHWGGTDGLSTFFGLTEQADQRVVLTNSNRLPEDVLEGRANFHSVRGHHLDKLKEQDFRSIREWLATGVVVHERWNPRPHQEEAITATHEAFKTLDRATLVMACGTGKTLVALWAAERQKAKNILVLVPSLALIGQTLEEWTKHNKWSKFSFLCVCSDKTVARGADALAIHTQELDFSVTTDAKEVRKYFQSSAGGTRVIFSTYQSAKVVAEGMRKKDRFDLGIFDEAHKTAGRIGKTFGFALQDENLRIGKRLFMTATPRHYSVTQRDKEGDAKLLFSMDVPEVYGPVVHTLSFAEAARQGIICDYKIVISVVTSEDVSREILRRGEVLVDGGEIKAHWVANQVALQKALEETGAHRVLTFHTTIREAKVFTSETGEGIGYHAPDYQVLHISGKMPTARRESIMGEFAEASKSLVSNARCLTEGVDVPAIDMVAFMSPKKSKVDIVQATGRAMRQSKETEKEVGYVFVPLFLQQHREETIEEALKRTDFDHVAYVLNAMKEHDQSLADEIESLRVEKGRTGGIARNIERVQVLGPTLDLSEISSGLVALVVDRLTESWSEMCGQLMSYSVKHGHTNVPLRQPLGSKYKRLGPWVNQQRFMRRKGKLALDRINLLDEIGFVWNPIDANWSEMFAFLVAFKSKQGHCNVSTLDIENEALGRWVSTQRRDWLKGKLSSERVVHLEGIGFDWNRADSVWQEMFLRLAAYKKKHGNCDVPTTWQPDPQLAQWVTRQRGFKGKETLDAHRVMKLENLGITWEPFKGSWEMMFDELVAFKAKYKHINVSRTISDTLHLANWIGHQRQYARNGKLSARRIKQLEEIGFSWNAVDFQWEEMYQLLKEYQTKHGDCDVAARYPENPSFGAWVARQRTNRQRGRLDNDRIRRLDEIGFDWNPKDNQWENMFSELERFQSSHGNCDVRPSNCKNSVLVSWVKNQRTTRNAGRMDAERQGKLNRLGFIWNTKDHQWEKMFRLAREFKTEHGHCEVTQSSNRQLNIWITNQRANYRKGNLLSDRFKRLDELGFRW